MFENARRLEREGAISAVAVLLLLLLVASGVATGTASAKTTVGQDGNATDLTGQDEVTVEVGAGQGFRFDPADVVVDEGTTVRWVWTGVGGQHNVVHSNGETPKQNPEFESRLTASQGHEFTHAFDETGVYDYVCAPHVAQGMVGSVEVVSESGFAEEINETYGGVESDATRSVAETSDGGFALAGRTRSFGSGGTDAWLVKTDGDGNEVTNLTFGGSGFDAANSVVETSNGGFALAGRTESFGSDEGDAWLIKTDGNGNVEINETFGGADMDRAWSVTETSDGGFALAGSTESFASEEGDDAWLIKTDGNGNVEFSRTFGGEDNDAANSVVETSDGGFALAGNKGDGAWLIKTDENGNVETEATFGEGVDDPDSSDSVVYNAFSVGEASEGGYVLAGNTYLTGISPLFTPDPSALLIKTDSDGNEEWQKTVSTIDDGTNVDRLSSVVETSDGGFVLAGRGNDAWLTKADSEGNLEFNESFGGAGYETANSVVETSDGGFALGGTADSFGPGGFDAWLLKVSRGGQDGENFEVTVSTNSPVTEGETLEFTATVTNTGGQQGAQTVTATAGSLGSVARTVTLGAGESRTEAFSVPTGPGDAGAYNVTVESDDDTATTTVTVEQDTGGGGSVVDNYRNQNGNVGTGGLQDAINDFIAGSIDTADLQAVINGFIQSR